MKMHPNSLANLKLRRKGGVPKDKAVRVARARKAGQASGRARHESIRELMRGVEPGIAWMLGYRRGYNAAMRRWKAYADEQIQQAWRARRKAAA